MNLVFVGKEALKYPQLEKSMETLNNADRSKISFMSDVSNEDLISLYSNAELFVFPSLSEGFGIPPLEAASFAIPVICSNSTSLSEYTFFGDDHINTSAQEQLIERLNLFSETRSVSYDLSEVQEVVSKKYLKNSENFLYFENLTRVPFELELINKEILTIDEINWINLYHEKVYRELANLINPNDRELLDYLKIKTLPI